MDMPVARQATLATAACFLSAFAGRFQIHRLEKKGRSLYLTNDRGGILKKVSFYEFLMYKNLRRVIHTKSGRNQQEFDCLFPVSSNDRLLSWIFFII
jgi:hypothetical protein